MFQKSVELLALDETLIAHPENEGTVLLVGDLSELAHTDIVVGCCFLNCKVGFLPNRDE